MKQQDPLQLLFPAWGWNGPQSTTGTAPRLVVCSQAGDPRPDSHLFYDRQKRLWFARFTIQVGPKVVGRRRKFPLDTRDIEEARRRRDLVIKTLRSLGLTVKVRTQRKQGHGVSKVAGRREQTGGPVAKLPGAPAS